MFKRHFGLSPRAYCRAALDGSSPDAAHQNASEDERFMREALLLAGKAAAEGEVPVGCVIVRNGEIVGRGRNRREQAKTALAHAEIEAISAACAELGGWRLWDCTLYVTLEPCPMCAGTAINAHIPRIVYGANEPGMGAGGSAVDLFRLPGAFAPEVVSGVLCEDCAALLRTFFRALRRKKKNGRSGEK